MGKSVRETKDHPSRYKMTRRTLLPKFGGEAHPSGPPVNARKDAKQVMKTDTSELVPPAPAKSPVPSPIGFRLAGWAFRRNPFAPSAVPAATRPVVQSELSLDAVKVVRNDLSDADLELVPLSQPTPSSVPAAQTAPRAIARMWGQLTARLFGAEKP